MNEINVFIRADLILYSIIIDLILIIYIKLHSSKEMYSLKLFTHLIISIAVVAALDALAWFALDIGNVALIPLNYWSNALFLSLNSLPVAFGLS